MSHLGHSFEECFKVIEMDAASKYTILARMEESKVFVIRTHGDADDSGISWLQLYDAATTDSYKPTLASTDIYNFQDEEALCDFQNVDLLIFAACLSAKGGETANNLVNAAHNAGGSGIRNDRNIFA